MINKPTAALIYFKKFLLNEGFGTQYMFASKATSSSTLSAFKKRGDMHLVKANSYLMNDYKFVLDGLPYIWMGQLIYSAVCYSDADKLCLGEFSQWIERNKKWVKTLRPFINKLKVMDEFPLFYTQLSNMSLLCKKETSNQ